MSRPYDISRDWDFPGKWPNGRPSTCVSTPPVGAGCAIDANDKNKTNNTTKNNEGK